MDLLFDSTYAANMSRRLWNPRSNASEVLFTRRCLDNLPGNLIQWHHVYSHLGHYLNELVDKAANLGAEGKCELNPILVDFTGP